MSYLIEGLEDLIKDKDNKGIDVFDVVDEYLQNVEKEIEERYDNKNPNEHYELRLAGLYGSLQGSVPFMLERLLRELRSKDEQLARNKELVDFVEQYKIK